MATSTPVWTPAPGSVPPDPERGDPTFTVVVPSSGCPPLVDTLANIASEIRPETRSSSSATRSVARATLHEETGQGKQAMSVCIPNVPGKVEHWIPVTPDWSDIYVVQEAAREHGAEPIFCDAVIGLARPEKNVLQRLRYAIRLRTRLRQMRGETYAPRD